MNKRSCPVTVLAAVVSCLLSLAAMAAENPFLGYWELTIPGGAAGWLGVEQAGANLKASMLWGWGSVEPVASARVEDGKLVLTRKHEIQQKDSAGKNVKKTIIETITATTQDDKIQLVSVKPKERGTGEDRAEFSGKRQPPMPPRPNLAEVKFGEPIQLFNGRDLTGWRLLDPNAQNGWSAQDGKLVNTVVKDEKQHKPYSNLRTEKEFEDFNFKTEVLVQKGENSGIYLRGIYEVQVADTYGRPVDSHNMGGLYSRITPSVAAEKPPGQWQTMDITLVDRHLTVILNGTKIIDNQPVLGCTGGALWSDVSRPGPIYLQGDHTGAAYRNMTLRPVLK